jgi:PAS domain S-box-containing protein
MASFVHTVLLVDDFAPDREMYRRCLRADASCEYRFLEAGSADAGLELCRTEAIDVILLDHVLPDSDGFAFIEALRDEGDSPPVMVITGEGDEEIAVKAMKLGAEDYLMKCRLTPEMLQLAVRSAIENAGLRRQLRQREVELQEANQRITTIWESMSDAYVTLDREWRIVYANSAAMGLFRQLTGLEPEELLGRTHWEVFPWSVGQIIEREYRRAVEEQVAVTFEVLYEPSGDWFEVHAYPSSAGLGIYFRNINDRLRYEGDRKRNEQRLQESQEQLQLGVQVAGVGIAKFDYASNVVTLSPEAAVMYGIPLDTLTVTRDRVHDTFHPDDRAELEQIIQQVIDPAGEGWFADEHRVMWQTGEVRWLNVRKQVFFDRSGEAPCPHHAILAAIDITDRKRAELERIQLLAEAQAAREEAEAANRSKDQFVAIVAHELRSPLNSVMGWAKLLRTRKLEESVMAKALETIVRNTEAQVQLVEDLLDMSRMVRGTLQIQMAPVNWGSVIEAALDLVRPMAEAKQIDLEVQLTAIPQISGDFNRLQQIAVNLLTNAIKFTPNQGRVSVYLERLEAQVQLRVCDTGKGIAAEFLPFIFEQFQQGQENMGAKDGLGLGLAIVKNLVELHGGTIAADSPGLGQGATFTVRLPILSAIDSAVDTPRTLDINSLVGIRILAVDDEPDMLDLITFVLRESGSDVQSALNSTEALAQLSQFKPDILISDIAMVGGTGYELLQQVRLQPEGNIPAIALTAYASATYEERSLQAGFDRHLTKPVKPEVLMTAIVQLVNSSNTRA